AQADPTVNPAAPADTAAGAPAAHAGSHAVVAEAVRGSPETVAHLSAEILKKFGERSTRFDVELHPADMGRVDVRLTIEADGRLKAQMAFDNPVAAADLRARADELRRSLEQAGFQVSEDSFSFADRNAGGGSFEDARQQFAEGGRARARAFRAGEQAASLADAPPVARRAVRLGVDVRI
ncbi:flagellar hook-length control protein FliK, partial [Caulobacter sp. 17J65-9]|uniref:flagellar hook-length control protein FliK n=1 Tax=Caulobacter sp. 17J65-9 TaxID=2709382 RepID=UPI001F093B43